MNLEQWIMEELPIDGEWWHDGYDSFIESSTKMLAHGMSVEEIKEILQDLYSAVTNEYGD